MNYKCQRINARAVTLERVGFVCKYVDCKAVSFQLKASGSLYEMRPNKF